MKPVHPNVNSVVAAPSEAGAGPLANGDSRTNYPLIGKELATLDHAEVPAAKELAECASYVRELEQALSRIGQLGRHLSVCFHCERIGDEWDNWQEIQGPIAKRWKARLSHTICPDCYESAVKPEVELLYAYLRGLGDERNDSTGPLPPGVDRPNGSIQKDGSSPFMGLPIPTYEGAGLF
jgi:hypothetical protein